jgi:hypothetical protein
LPWAFMTHKRGGEASTGSSRDNTNQRLDNFLDLVHQSMPASS